MQTYSVSLLKSVLLVNVEISFLYGVRKDLLPEKKTKSFQPILEVGQHSNSVNKTVTTPRSEGQRKTKWEGCIENVKRGYYWESQFPMLPVGGRDGLAMPVRSSAPNRRINNEYSTTV